MEDPPLIVDLIFILGMNVWSKESVAFLTQPLIKDGGIGTSLISSTSGSGNNHVVPETLNITHPDLVTQIHKGFIVAGADIITTNTFNSYPDSLPSLYNYEDVIKMDRAGARLAIKIAQGNKRLWGCPKEKKILVAGSIGPGQQALSKVLRLNNDNLSSRSDIKNRYQDWYYNKIRCLSEENVDLLLFETFYDSLNALVALEAYEKYKASSSRYPPFIFSITCDNAGRLYSGELIEDIIKDIECLNPIAIGINCVALTPSVVNFITTITRSYSGPVYFCPNIISENTKIHYESIKTWSKKLFHICCQYPQIKVVGGCCGVTSGHIRLLSKEIAKTIPPA